MPAARAQPTRRARARHIGHIRAEIALEYLAVVRQGGVQFRHHLRRRALLGTIDRRRALWPAEWIGDIARHLYLNVLQAGIEAGGVYTRQMGQRRAASG